VYNDNETAGRYIQEDKPDWLNQPIGVELYRTPDGLPPEWPVKGYIGPSPGYRMPFGQPLGGCGVCGGFGVNPMTAADMAVNLTSPGVTDDTLKTTTTATWLIPALIAGGALLLFWGTLAGGAKKNAGQRQAPPKKAKKLAKRHFRGLKVVQLRHRSA